MDMYKLLIDESPLPYVMIRRVQEENEKSLKIEYINKGFQEVFNLKIEDVINKYLEDFINEGKIKYLQIELDELKNNNYTILKHIEIKQEYYNVEIYNYVENEFYIRLLKTNSVNKKLSKILRNSPFIAWIKDLEGRYLDINNKYLEVYNLKSEDIIGKKDEEIWSYDVATTFTEKDKEVIDADNVVQYKEYLEVDGKRNRIFETAKWPYTEGDKVLGTTGVSIEITDKVKLEAIIKKSEQYLLDIANNLNEVIIIRDRDKALYVSPYFEELFGYKPDQLYEDINNWNKYWDNIEYLEEKIPYDNDGVSINVVRVVKNGKIDKWLQSKFIPIYDDTGNIVRKIGLIQDITEKKKLDNEIENLRLEFFANLSHELRTPINLIMSALQIIDLKLDNEVKGHINKYLRIISQNGLRLTRLVNNLIDITKIDSGHFNFNPENRDIIHCVENICMSVVEFVEKNNLEIIFDTDVEEKIIAFDVNQMERIILNLISNAIKFNKPEGKIEVTISTKDDVRIKVKDTGIGIPNDKCKHIFERFEQVNKHSRREREGSGIGLSLVKSLVEMHNGTIQLESTLHKGSEFVITLPDVVLKKQQIDTNKNNDNEESQINKMEVEFSDIYC